MKINPFDLWVLIPTVLSVVAFVAVPYVRKVAEWFVTIIHEAGHGVFSLLTGNGISGIKLHRDGSGSTTTTHYRNIFSKITRTIVLFSGYSAPIYLGVILAVLNLQSWGVAAFYVLIGVGLMTLIFLRNFFGIIILGLYFLILAGGMFFANGEYMPAVVNFFALLFLIGGMKDIILIAKPVFQSGRYNLNTMSDFHILQEESMFNIPAQVWYIIFILWNVALFGGIIYLLSNATV